MLVNLDCRPGLLLTLGEKKVLMPFQSLSWFEINGLPDLQSFNRWSTWNLEPEVFMFSPHSMRSFTILAEIPLGNSTFMAKDGPDTSAGRPRCETSNFGIHAVLTLEADMVKTCENNKLVGIKSGIISPASLTNRAHYHRLGMSRAFVSTSCRFSPIDLGLSNHPSWHCIKNVVITEGLPRKFKYIMFYRV